MKTILVDAVNTLVIKERGVFKEMQDLLEEYPNQKIVLTNASQAQIIDFGLDKLPYALFTLEHDPEKTDPEYFKRLLKHYNLSVNEVIYFEHNQAAVASAQSLGIKTYYYNHEEANLRELKKFIDEGLDS